MPLIEFGLDPERRGMEIAETIVDEDVKYNPGCPCRTRTCPQHGFCRYCVAHHSAHGEKGHRPVCQRVPREAVGRVKGDRLSYEDQ